MNTRLYSLQRKVGCLRNILVRKMLQVAEDDDFPVLIRQGSNGAKDISVRLVPDQHILRRLLPIRDLEGAELFFARGGRIQGGTFQSASTVSLSEPVLALVQRDLAEPRVDFAVAAERSKALEGINKGLLREILRLFPIADLAQHQIEDPALVLLYDLFKAQELIFVVSNRRGLRRGRWYWACQDRITRSAAAFTGDLVVNTVCSTHLHTWDPGVLIRTTLIR